MFIHVFHRFTFPDVYLFFFLLQSLMFLEIIIIIQIENVFITIISIDCNYIRGFFFSFHHRFIVLIFLFLPIDYTCTQQQQHHQHAYLHHENYLVNDCYFSSLCFFFVFINVIRDRDSCTYIYI